MQCIGTIITADYFPRALALYRSVTRFEPGVQVYILIVDNDSTAHVPSDASGLHVMTLAALRDYPMVDELFQKYGYINLDQFRWSMKSVFASWLLETKVDKLLYLDCDMFVVHEYSFLWNDLDEHGFIFTPNWNSKDPFRNQAAFLSNFTHGLYSAGFFGASRQGLPVLRWWAEACHFRMGEHAEEGVVDDQRYLDAIPAFFETAKIIRHRGCNVGSWNVEESRRIERNGQVYINDEFPVVFLHFDEMLAAEIIKGHDPHLLGYLQDYRSIFEKEGYQLDKFLTPLQYEMRAGAFHKLKWRLRLRTRIKRFFYKAAKSI